jgi:hypothetical protein
MDDFLEALAFGGVLFFAWYFLSEGAPEAGTATAAEAADDSEEATVNADKIGIWAQITAKLEGWGLSAHNRPTRNNNPGNIEGHVAGSIGVDAQGFAIFPTAEAGEAALHADLLAKANKYPNYSLLQISARYFGGDVNNIPVDGNIYSNGQLQGNAITRAQAVAAALGVSVNNTLAEVFA